MKKLFVLVGDGGSGKTTLIAKLVEQHSDKFRKVVTCTSRLMRQEEVDGEDYHFLPTSYFVNNPDLVLVKRTDNGNHYGTRREDLQSVTRHSLLTLRFTGISRLLELGLSNVVIVRISISETLKINRMRQRGDTEDMIANRLDFDTADRTNVDYGSFTILDLQAADALTKKVERILRAC